MYVNRRPVCYLKYSFSENGFCLCFQVEHNQLGSNRANHSPRPRSLLNVDHYYVDFSAIVYTNVNFKFHINHCLYKTGTI